MASSSIENIVEAVEEEDWINLPTPEGFETPVDFDILNESFRRVDHPPAWIETFKALELKIDYAHGNVGFYELATMVTLMLTLIFFVLTLLVLFKVMPDHYTVTCVTLLFISIFLIVVFFIKYSRVYKLREYCIESAMAVVPPGQDEFVIGQELKERYGGGWLRRDRYVLHFMRRAAIDFFRIREERFNPEAAEVQRTLRAPLDMRY